MFASVERRSTLCAMAATLKYDYFAAYAYALVPGALRRTSKPGDRQNDTHMLFVVGCHICTMHILLLVCAIIPK